MSFEDATVRPPPLPPMPEPPAVERPLVWGAWATVGLGLAIGAVLMVVQGVMALIYMFSQPGVVGDEPEAMMEMAVAIQTDAWFLGVMTIVGAAVAVPLVFLAAWLRGGLPVRDYLRIKPVKPWVVVGWSVVGVLYSLGLGLGIEEMGQGTKGEEFMSGILESAFAGGSLPLLYVAVVLGAPLVEEVFFRGFAFEGLMRSPLGFWGANVVTSLGWTLLHIQYGLPELTMLFFGGLLFGYARVRTGSLVTPVAMHVAWNLSAMVLAQMAYG